MGERTPRFGLPLLQAGQAQKEVLHNEALIALEALCQPIVETVGDDAPPSDPVPGRAWIVGMQPTGDWSGRAGALAIATSGGWRFVAPTPGTTATLRTSGVPVRWNGNSWTIGVVTAQSVVIGTDRVLGARQPAVPDPAGGTTVDAQARTAVSQLLTALRLHGLIQA